MLVIASSMSSSVGLRILREQRGRGHDLAGLAVAALRHVERGHAFCTGCERVADRPSIVTILSVGLTAPTGSSTTHHLPVDVHRARAALRDAAAVLGAGQADLLPDHPEQRRVGSTCTSRTLPLMLSFAICVPSCWIERPSRKAAAVSFVSRLKALNLRGRNRRSGSGLEDSAAGRGRLRGF